MFTTIRRWALYALGLLAGWLSVLAIVMLISDAAPGAIVLLPSDDFAQNLPDGVGIVSQGAFWIGVRGDGPHLGRSLYRAGGKLVLPAGLPGCLPLATPN